jgi:subtilisin family serine protease
MVGAIAAGALVAAAVAVNVPAWAAPGDRTYIVTFKSGIDADGEATKMREQGRSVRHVYRNVFPGVVVDLSSSAASNLQRNPNVERVEADQPVAKNDTRSPATWGLDRIHQRSLPLDNTYSYPTSAGNGVFAYVIDSGVKAGHSEFGGRVRTGYSAVADGRGTEDCDGHGTHVAGTVAGATWGVASRASIVPVRVLDCVGSGTVAGVIAGLDYVAGDTTRRPAVANLSLGGGANQSLDDALNRVVAAGVTVVAAAGNSNADACSFSPGRAAAAVTVGSITSSDARASYSNYGSCLDLFAPGSSITSASISSDTATVALSGTSMAAPHVAGGVALLLGDSPGLSPAQVMTALSSESTQNVVIAPGAGSPNRLLFVEAAPSLFGPGSGAPVNDAFGSSVPIGTAASGSVSGRNDWAGKEAGEPAHAGSAGGASVWYQMTAAADTPVQLTTQGSSFDTLLAVYTGSSVGALTPVAANDSADGGHWSKVAFEAVAGTTYRIAVDGQSGATGAVTLGWTIGAAGPVAVSTASLPPATTNVAYSQQLGVNGGSGSVVWSLAGGTLPAGLTLGTNGVLSGTPTTAGASSFTVAVTDGLTSATRVLTVTVAPPLSVATTALPSGTVGAPYSQPLVAAGGSGAYTWSLAGGALPAGLGLSANGLVSGTATTKTTATFTVQVNDTDGRVAIRSLTIVTASVPAPGAFAKTTPVNGATGRSRSGLVLSWAASSNAGGYEVCVAPTASCGTGSTGWLAAGSNLSITLGGFNGRTVYYWQVRAVNATGTTLANSGTWWKFTTAR